MGGWRWLSVVMWSWRCCWFTAIGRGGSCWFIPSAGLIILRSAQNSERSSLDGGPIRVKQAQRMGMLFTIPGGHKDHLTVLECSDHCQNFAVYQQLRTGLKS